MLSKRLDFGLTSPVLDSLEGVAVADRDVQLLDGFPDIKVAVCPARIGDSKVAVTSGGGSGHEPAFAGYVGEGMLAAAVSGSLFAAPSAESVLAAVRTVCGPAGCLLIVINYTGDRLNFGLAAERAKAEGYKVEMVLLEDDCSMPVGGSVGRRGLAGSIFILKLVGAFANSGASLEEVTRFAREAAKKVGTVGVGLDTRAMICQPSEPSRLEPNEIELGLGVHGEPGVQKLRDLDLDSIVKKVTRMIIGHSTMSIQSGESVGVMVNNLGGLSPLEMNLLTKKVLEALSGFGVNIAFSMSGSFFTSITVDGFSVSVLKMCPGYNELLVAPTTVQYWTLRRMNPYHPSPKLALPMPLAEDDEGSLKVSETEARLYKECLQAVVDGLKAKVDILNEWDRRVGDGDCGTTLGEACASIEADMGEYPFESPDKLLRCIGRSIGRSSGGTSGALYGLGLSAASNGMAEGRSMWINALERGIQAVKTYGRAELGDRTMLDVLQPVLDSLRRAIDEEVGIEETMSRLCSAAINGADSTKGMVAKAGRSNYVPEEDLKGVPDPGAKAVQFWMEALASVLRGT